MEYYIPINRRLFEHPFWCEERTFSRFEAWLDIVQSARFEDTKQLIGNRFIEVRRGQMLVSLRFLSNRWQWSTKKVNAFLELLIQDKMITKETPKETGQTVITICNYDKYNFKNIEEETSRKQQGNTKETAGKQDGNKVNKDNKEKELEESKETSTNVEAKKAEQAKKLAAAKAATLKRRDAFYQSLIPYVERYGKEMIRVFFDYWSELNKSETKMKFETNQTWEVSKRLTTWANREKLNGKSNNSVPTARTYSTGRASQEKAASRQSLENLADAILGEH
jgi:hypothetical protein